MSGDDGRAAAQALGDGGVRAFQAVIDNLLATGDVSDVPTLLACAYAAGLAALRTSDGDLDIGLAEATLPGNLAWLEVDPAADDIDPEDLLDALPQDASELVELLEQLVDEVEWLASIDDSNYAGFTSSGASSFYALHHAGRVYSFSTDGDGDYLALVHEYDEPDPAGRDRMLHRLIDDWLMVAGSIDVSLGDAFDADLRQAVRAASERNGNAPWDTGILEADLADVDDDELRRLALEHAPALRTDEADVLAALRRLRADPEKPPGSEFDRRVAWRVTWPDLDTSQVHGG